jgi:hypothetical protein
MLQFPRCSEAEGGAMDDRVVALAEYLHQSSNEFLAVFVGFCCAKVKDDPKHPFWDLVEKFRDGDMS